jgi:hypothetical protein
VALHSALLPDGRVMTYGTDLNGRQTGKFFYDVWDPSAANVATGHLTLDNTTGTDLFCAGQLLLSDRSLLLAGGDVYVQGNTTNVGNPDTNVFNPSTNQLTSTGTTMNLPRWYATLTKTYDDRVFIQGGRSGEAYPEMRDANGSYRALSAIDTSTLHWWYPRNYSAPDGRIFGYELIAGQAYTMTFGGTGTIVRHGALAMPVPGEESSSALIGPGRALQCGGNEFCSVVDFNGPRPAVESAAKMTSRRQWNSSTVLPDGRVLITGGALTYTDAAYTGPTNQVEFWNPKTGQWSTGATAVQPRLYHSTALLLPDATVLVAGGGAPGPLTQLNAEIYRPPYLFANGVAATRPVITSAPTVTTPGSGLSVQVDNGAQIARLVLIKTGSITHSFGMDQAFIELPFTRSGNTIAATVPDSGGDVTPGFYMVFVLDTAGVPSVAKIVRMNVAPTSPPIAPWTTEAGTVTGADFKLECEPGQVMVGAHGLAGTTVSQIGPKCVWVDTDGKWIGTPWKHPLTGSGTTGTAFDVTCPTDQAVSGFQGRFGAQVSQIQLRCRTVAAGGLKVTAGTGALATAIGTGSTGTVRALEECGGGFAAYGLYGYSNTTLNATGLLCRRPVDAINVKKPGTVAPTYAFTQLGDEDLTFTVPPRSIVRYGTSTSSQYADRMVSGTFTATNAFFGGDPAPGSPKKVWLRVQTNL